VTDGLTERQQQFLALLPASTADIAAALNVAETTVEGHRNAIREKGVTLEYDRSADEWRAPAYTPPGGDAADAPAATDESAETPDSAAADGDSDADADAEADAAPTIPDLDAEQRSIIAALPASTAELAETLDRPPGEALSALDRLRADGITVRFDADGGVHYLADERSKQLRSQSHLSLSAKTKRAKEQLREEQALLDRLPDTEPLSIRDRDPAPETETMVAAIGDLHFGDEVTDDRGRVTYDREIAHEAADRFARNVIKNSRQWAADFDDCVIAFLGDIATGTEIYDTQREDIGQLLARQIADGAQALTRIVTTLREHFAAVRVRCVVGNHGFQSPSAARGSNTDLICYYWMRDALRREGYDDVDVLIADSSHHLNVDVRGWRIHLRHRQDSQQQVDETARSEADWRGWRDKHQFDVAIRGHHHVPSLHWILNRYPAVTVPSPKPGGEFADRIGDPDSSTPADRLSERKLGYCFGISEDRRLTDSRMTDAG